MSLVRLAKIQFSQSISCQFGSPWRTRDERTSKEMCSLPSLISSSWRPSLFFCGHFVSSSLRLVSILLSNRRIENKYFKISLSFTMRLISETNASLTHTMIVSDTTYADTDIHTLFADEGVIAVVWVVGVSCRCTAAISQHPKIELCLLVSAITWLFNSSIYLRTRVRIVLGDLSCTVVRTI